MVGIQWVTENVVFYISFYYGNETLQGGLKRFWEGLKQPQVPSVCAYACNISKNLKIQQESITFKVLFNLYLG